ncbi:hypothetical protein C2S51_036657 [Perilla frutescens var. frutescens]|nr:hypothetical protein C2S51_036657 [Perilla frutescens var. frutescens]
MNLQDQNDDTVEAAPGELLEDCWFFGNLLQTKSKSNSKSSRLMLRSLSDPCSSSSFPGKSYEETYDSITKRERSNRETDQNLVRAPSLPTSFETSHNFHDDEEMEFSMGKLIRQASLNHSDSTRPPRRINTAKSLTKLKSRLKAPEMESVDDLKSLKDLEIEGFKNYDDKELSIVSIVQDKKRVEECGERRGARAAPPVPRWGGKRSTEDMKAQIKFWARAVASNVRQEC